MVIAFAADHMYAADTQDTAVFTLEKTRLQQKLDDTQVKLDKAESDRDHALAELKHTPIESPKFEL